MVSGACVTVMSKMSDEKLTERRTLSMYTLKLNGSSASSKIDEMDEEERALNRRPPPDPKDTGRSASSATMPGKDVSY